MLRLLFLLLVMGTSAFAQTQIHEHALAPIGADRWAVVRGTMTIEIWGNPEAPRLVQSLKVPDTDGVASLAASSDGRYLAAGGEFGKVFVWDLTTGNLLHKVKLHRFKVWTVAFSPDATLLASGAFDGTVKILDLGTGLEAGAFVDRELQPPKDTPEGTAHTGWVRCVTFSPDGRFLASSGCDGYVRVWDLQTLRLLQKIRGGINVYSVAFSPDGRYLAWGNNPGEVRVAQVGTWAEVQVFSLGNPAFCVAFSPDGQLLAAGGHQRVIWVWGTANWREKGRFSGHTGRIWGLCFLGEDLIVSTAEEEGEARVWRIEG